jgi:arginyl-tRNA synthetase
MREVFPDYLTNLPPLKDLNIFYREAKAKFDANEDFKKLAQLTVVKLQSGDEDCLKAWKVICEISR